MAACRAVSSQGSWPWGKALCPAFAKKDFGVRFHPKLGTEVREVHAGQEHGHTDVTQKTRDFGRHTPEAAITKASFQEHLSTS